MSDFSFKEIIDNNIRIIDEELGLMLEKSNNGELLRLTIKNVLRNQSLHLNIV